MSVTGKKRLKIYTVISVVLIVNALILFISYFSPGAYAENLMMGIKAKGTVDNGEIPDEYTDAVIDFSIELFKRAHTAGQNSVIAPFSVYSSLAMTANGASGDTLKQFEDVLGNGMSIDKINKYTSNVQSRFPNEADMKIETVNSIWFDRNIYPSREFLQENADYYDIDMFKINLEDENKAIDRINMWIKERTNGKVEKLIDELDPGSILMVNTMFFDGKWLSEAFKGHISTTIFYMADNTGVEVEFMTDRLKYIKNDMSTGFICPYAGDYSFVALLPNFDVSVDEYIADLSGEDFKSLINFDTKEKCVANMPKFKYGYSVDMKDMICDMGITGNEFSRIIGNSKQRFETLLSDINNKTDIEVNEERTVVGTSSSTTVPVKDEPSAANFVELNRPFVYAIVENSTKIPLFIGSVNTFEGEIYKTVSPTKGIYTEIYDDFQYEVFELSYNTVYNIQKYLGTEDSVDIQVNTFGGIKEKAFEGNQFIEEIKIDMPLMTCLGDRAFADCKNLKDIYFYSDIINEVGKDIFKGSDNVVIHCYEDYKNIRKYAEENNIQVEIIK